MVGPRRRRASAVRTRGPVNQTVRHATITVSRAAIAKNVRAARAMLGASKLIAVVKANAYGHGLLPVAEWVLEDGADLVAVAYVDEAVALRDALPDGCARVLVLGALLPDDTEEAALCGALLTVQDVPAARSLSEAAARLGARVRVHLKVDTGMSRLGIPHREAESAARAIVSLPGIDLEGAFTHLATADAPDDLYAREQLARWAAVCDRLPAGVMKHCCASAGLVRFAEWKQDAARLGLLVYGIDPLPPLPPGEGRREGDPGDNGLQPIANEDIPHPPIRYARGRPLPEGEVTAPLSLGRGARGEGHPEDNGLEPVTCASELMPALRLAARLVQIRTIEPGTGVSYGATFRPDRQTRLGVVPVGYADGWPRALSGCGYVVVRGHRAPIVGRVCMDQFMIDITDVPGVEVGEELTLIGPGAEVNEVAAVAGTINHELLSRLGQRLRREYI